MSLSENLMEEKAETMKFHLYSFLFNSAKTKKLLTLPRIASSFIQKF